MLGFFSGKKNEQPVKINLNQVVDTLDRRFWDFEKVENRPDRVVVNGNYRNHQRSFKKLILQFVGDNVQFKDEIGRPITNISSSVPQKEMYPTLMNILNVFA
jgi:hypothetical protein